MSTSTPRTTIQNVAKYATLVGVAALAGYAVAKLIRQKRSGKKGGCCCSSSAPAASSAVGQQKPRVVFVLGGPGAGKGTQCAHIVEDFGFVHLSAGDLLRDEQKKGGDTGNMIKKLIAEGAIVPVAVTLGLIKQAMQEHQAQGRNLFLVDGFPRNYDNLTGWNTTMGDFAQVDFCLFLDCPESVMEARLLKRGETSGRSDDNADSIRKRFKTYVESTKPVIETFEKEAKLKQVLAAAPVEEVRVNVANIFKAVQWQ